MKKIFSPLFFIFILVACDSFGSVPPLSAGGTLSPSSTPAIVTATPIIFTPTFAKPLVPGVTEIVPVSPTSTEIPSPTATSTPVPPSETSTPISTATAVQSVAIDILGCDTSFDLIHGMGEVTNAYVTVKNTGTADLPNTCALLRAIDEDREHPDKQVCISNLPVQNQVTLKLTVDSTYKQSTIIQVDATSNEVILLRVDKPSCTDIGLFGGAPADLDVVKPIE